MSRVVKKIVILGSGTAGLMAAASLRKHVPDIFVTILQSKDIPIIGVGEGTTLTVTDHLHDYLKVPAAMFFDVARPTWKLGIRFNWGPRKSFYYPFVASVDAYVPGVPHPIGFYSGEKLDYVDPWSALMKHDKAFPRSPQGAPIMAGRKFAYHFENEKLVDFMERYTSGLGVHKMEGTVVDVRRDDFGVTGLVLKSGEIVEADLFVDCSGFVSTLLGKAMNEPFVSYKSTLFCDRAVVGGWYRSNEPIKPYTTCDTLNCGWSWQIEHENRINRGYVYSSDFISDDEADREFRSLNPKITETRIVKFRSGRYQNVWAGNVVAIGNSAGFVEPLEATAIGAICMQSRLLAEALRESGGRILKTHTALYNNQCARNWDSIRMFLAVHYKYNTLIDTPFWRAIWADCDLAGAEPIIDYYRETGPTSYWKNLVDSLDFAGISGYFTLLAGQDVPFDIKYEPTPEQRAMIDKVIAMHRAQAMAGMTVEETLRIIRDSRWQWAA